MAFRSDDFDSATAQDLKTGGDGQKQFEWRVMNSSYCDAIDVNTSNAGYLTFDMNATDCRNNAGQSPAMAYQYITGDFDVETLFTSNGDQNYEACYLMACSDSNVLIKVFIFEYAGNSNLYTNAARSCDGTTLTTVGTDSTVTGAANSHRYLRMVRSGNDFSLYRKKASGDSWTLHGTSTRSDIGSRVRVGLATVTGNTSNTFVGQFDYFYGTVANTSDYPAAQRSGARPAVMRAATR